MDRHEKKVIRAYIGRHLDVSNARLTDGDASFLKDFIDNYDKTYRGRAETWSRTQVGRSSDGKYTRRETFTDTFIDDIGIRKEYEFQADDGEKGHATNVIRDVRGILTWFRNRH